MGRRRNPWKRVKTPAGWRVKYDYKDNVLGIPRTRQTFNTVEEAQDFHERLINNHRKVARGEKPVRTFGEALVEYLTMESVSKASHLDDLKNSNGLRCPFEYRGKFWRLEDMTLDDSDTGIVVGLELYFKDLARVVKRSYINAELYYLIPDGRTEVWYHQPHPAADSIPQPRYPVTEPGLLDRLNKAKGRGPFKRDTLRNRQALASSVLTYVYRRRRWTDTNLADFLERIKPGDGRTDYLTPQQLAHLFELSTELYGKEFTRLLKGASWIGWRRSNVIGLTWDRVYWSEETTDPITGETFTRPGYLIVEKASNQTIDPFDRSQRETRTKNKAALITTMTARVESLLRECEQNKHKTSPVVFHKGDGTKWGDFRKRWDKLKSELGIPARFRFHDLRHTWATEALNAGVDHRTIMDEQGWKDHRMVDRYSHTSLQGRFEQMNRIGRRPTQEQSQQQNLPSKGDNNGESDN